MIDLTPLDIRKKKEDFRRVVRGYDVAQVSAFLDLAAERLGQLVSDSGALADRVAALEEQLAHYKERERALNEALLTAQELREEARSQAERDASIRLREAETHAEALLLEADQAIRNSQRRLKETRAQRTHLLRTLRSTLERFTENLELEESRLESESEELGDLPDRDVTPARRVPQAKVDEEPPSAAGQAESLG